jgi:hypothetical protein
MILYSLDGFGVEDEASFDDRARYVHFDGSAEEGTLDIVSQVSTTR